MIDAIRIISKLGRRMKKGRQQYWDRENFVFRLGQRFGKAEAALFFRTRGCRYDAGGGCTMCDYSAGPPTTSSFIINSVRQGLDALPINLESILISPSGSFLDPWEVPPDARWEILQILAEKPYTAIAFESRAETVTGEVIASCRAALPGRRVKIYCGLESADPWVLQYAINKQMQPGIFVTAMQTLNANNIIGVANVLLGAPFLSQEEVIWDCVATIQWAFSVGATEFCLFPCHVKRWTQLEWLYRNNFYRPPSLWSLVEVLHRLEPEIVASHGEIAWFSGYGAFNILVSPTSCNACHDTVIDLLDGFARTNDFIFIDRLVARQCVCKEKWMRSFESPVVNSREERAAMAYDQIGQELFAEKWSAMRDRALEPFLTSMMEKAQPSIGGTTLGEYDD